MTSPYETVLGPSLEGLAPRLRTYFSQIPEGSIGLGQGVFDAVGTPRRWLWPMLRLLERDGVILAVWQTDVAFTVINTPHNGAVAATRTFHLPGGDWTMVDEIGGYGGSLVDVLGRSRRLHAYLDAAVVDGGLALRSTTVEVRLGGIRLRIPRFLAPRVALSERFDELDGRQHVGLSLTAPLVGKLYEYSGSFTYVITTARDSAAADPVGEK